MLGVGIFFRFYRIGDIPPGLNHDAAFNGLYAIRINRASAIPLSWSAVDRWLKRRHFPTSSRAFSRLVGYTAFAIELGAVSVGIATLVVFYFLIRRMFDHWVALVATLLLGVSGWHMTYSRVGWHCILVPLFEALTFYLLLRALESKRVRDYLLAGVALGLSLYTYDAGKTIPLSVAVFLVYMLIRNRSLILTRLWLFAAYGVAALVAFAPLGWYIHNNWSSYIGRSRALWIGHQIEAAGSWAPFWHNIGDGLLIFNFRAHGDDFFIREPLLDVPVSVFFVLGLAYSLTPAQAPGTLPAANNAGPLPRQRLPQQPNGNPALGAVLPVTAYAALFLVVAWRWLRQAFPPLASYSSLGLVAVLVLSAYSTFHSYLGPDRRVQWGFYPEATRVGRYVKTIADNYEVHLAAGNWPRNTLTYLSYGGEGDPFTWRYTYTQDASDLLGMAPAAQKGTAFIIEAVPNNQTVIDELHRRYPDAEVHDIYYPDGSNKAIAVALLVPPTQRRRRRQRASSRTHRPAPRSATSSGGRR